MEIMQDLVKIIQSGIPDRARLAQLGRHVSGRIGGADKGGHLFGILDTRRAFHAAGHVDLGRPGHCDGVAHIVGRQPARQHPGHRPAPPGDQPPVKGQPVAAWQFSVLRRLGIHQKLIGDPAVSLQRRQVLRIGHAQHLDHRQAVARGIPLEVLALGGPRMQAAGAELLADTAPLGSIGLLEHLPQVLPTLKLQARVNRELLQRPPDAVVLIDYMGANVRLGQRLRRQLPQVPITYYIAPQEWAWRFGDGSTTRLLDFTDRILAIFPAEAEFYAARGADVSWVGHPLLDSFQNLPERASARRELGLDPEAPVLLLLPASRPQELRYLMPPLAQAAALLQQRHPDLQVLLPAGLAEFEAPLAAALQEAGVRHGRVIPAAEADGLKTTLCAAADLALGKSGTVNLELALQEVPQVWGTA